MSHTVSALLWPIQGLQDHSEAFFVVVGYSLKWESTFPVLGAHASLSIRQESILALLQKSPTSTVLVKNELAKAEASCHLGILKAQVKDK